MTYVELETDICHDMSSAAKSLVGIAKSLSDLNATLRETNAQLKDIVFGVNELSKKIEEGSIYIGNNAGN